MHPSHSCPAAMPAAQLQFEPLTTASPHMQPAVQLYESAFPPAERRPVAAWTRLASGGDERYHAWALTDEAHTLLGFITWWRLGHFVYVEHFAVNPSCRGAGRGSQALKLLTAKVAPLPIVLEVEPPTDAITQRRVAFYERAGFTLSALPYRQPPYPGGDADGLELRLMTTEPSLLQSGGLDVVRAIHAAVYGVDK